MTDLDIEMELMDPADYWRIHKDSWHRSGDVAGYCHYPKLANFYYDLEEDAAWFMATVLGVSPN